MKADRYTVEAVDVWISQYTRLKEQTQNFQMDIFAPLEKSEVEYLITMQLVSHSFLEFSGRMFSVFKPESHSELRRNIAYLAALQTRQNAAFEDYQRRGNLEVEFIRQTIRNLKAGADLKDVHRYLNSKV